MDLLPDKRFDRSEVDQFGFVDLCEVFDKGVVSGDFNISDESYNCIPPDCVMSRPDDMFAAIRQKNYVQKTLRAAEASARDSAANAK